MISYSEYFGFTKSPFKRTPDMDFYFPSKSHEDALSTLSYLLLSEDEFAVLIGESGSGKSLVLRKFMSELPADIMLAYIMFPYLQPSNFFKALLEDFEIPVDNNLSDNAIYSCLKEHLMQLHSEGKKVLIIIDEAQNLPDSTLEELRILSNLETDTKKLLKIILVGQPSLENKLNSSALKGLNQRIILRSTLSSLTPTELMDYVNNVLRLAGGNKKLGINKNLAKHIWQSTHGNPWRVNILMERVLIVAHMDEAKIINKNHINSAISSMNTLGRTRAVLPFPSRIMPVVTFAMILIIVISGFFGYKYLDSNGFIDKYGFILYKKPADVAISLPATTTVAKKPPVVEVPKVVIEQPKVVSAPQIVASKSVENIAGPVPDKPEVPVVVATVNSNPEVPAVVIVTPKLEDSGMFGVGNNISITSTSLNVRSEPLVDAKKLGSVKQGMTFKVVDENRTWVKILFSGDQHGWVSKEFLEKE